HREDLLGRVPVEQGVLALHGAQRVDGVRPPDGGRRGFREAQGAHLPLLHQPRHRADRLLDRHLGIDPVLEVEVDDVDAEAAEAGVAGLLHVGGPAVHEIALAVGAPHLAELRGHAGPIAPALHGPAEQLRVVALAVHVEAVQEVDPAVHGCLDHGDRLGVVARTVDAGHRHAAQPDGRDLEVAVSQLAVSHDALLSGREGVPTQGIVIRLDRGATPGPGRRAGGGMSDFHTTRLPATPDAVAPDGAEVRVLLSLRGGGLAHFELAPRQISIAVAHRTVEEIWFFLEGRGEMWRRQADREAVVPVEPGVCLTIPLGTHFQLRAVGDTPLAAIGVTMPLWPGEGEAYPVPGPWPATVTRPTRSTPVHPSAPFQGEDRGEGF